MSADWIKLRGSLMTHPKVARIGAIVLGGLAQVLPRDVLRDVLRDVTLASLCRVWLATNEHTTDGTWHDIDLAHLDGIAGYPGFAAAMETVGWLLRGVDKSTVALPNFLEWNAPAKGGKRSAGAERQAAYRARLAAQRDPNSDGQDDVTSDVTSDVTVTPRVRDRDRTKKKPPNPRKRGSGDRFPDFWLAWPKSERKQDKAKCLDHWKLHDLNAAADAILADVRAKRGSKKWAGGYDEAPLTYLRGKRWEDHAEAGEAADLSEWWETAAGALKKAKAVGYPKWDECIAFPAYLAGLRKHIAEHEAAPA